VIAYYNSTSQVGLAILDRTTLVQTLTQVIAETKPIQCINLTRFGTLKLSVNVAETATTGKLVANMVDPSNLVLHTAWTVTNTPGYNIVQITGAVTVDSSKFQLYWQTEPITGGAGRILWVTNVSYATSGPTTQQFVRGQALASNAFIENGLIYMLSVFPSPSPSFQQTYFLLLDTTAKNQNATYGAQAVVKAFPGSAGAFDIVPRLPTFQQTSSHVWSASVPNQANFTSQNGVPVLTQGIQRLTFDFTTGVPHPKVLGPDLVIEGGLPQVYDGVRLVEQNFNYFPEPVTAISLIAWGNILITQQPDNSTKPQIAVLTIAVNPDGSTHDGSLIQGGEFITYGGSENGLAGPNAFYAFFVVNGVGTDPALGGAFAGRAVQITVSSKDSASSIATMLALNVTFRVNAGAVIGAQPNQVLLTYPNNKFLSPPSWNSIFTVGESFVGSGAAPGVLTVSATSGALITGGQYFRFASFDAAHTAYLVYCWFQVTDSVTGAITGTDPGIGDPATTIPIQVNIASANTEAQVAVAINGAIALSPLVLIAGLATVSVNGNQVTITNLFFDAAAVPIGHPYIFNPPTGGVGMNCLGSGSGLGQNYAIAISGGPQYGNGLDNYFAQAVYEHIDGTGQLDRSAPSVQPPSSVPNFLVTPTIAFPSWVKGVMNLQVKYTVPTLRLTQRKLPNCSAADIAIYRSAPNNADILQRVTSQSTPLLNDHTVDSVTWSDRLSDQLNAGNEVLYTAGGVTENAQLPACSISIVHRNRMWVGGLEDPQVIWFSRTYEAGFGVEFSAQQFIRIDPLGGKVTGFGSVDTNLVVLTEGRVWVVSGEGPDPNGGGQGFSEPTLVTSTTGCRDPQSVFILPDGLVFKSEKGWYLLDRSMSMNYIGAEVEKFNDDICTSADVINGTTEVRMLSSSGTTLLYDYFYKLWGTFTNHSGVDSIVLGGIYYYLRSDGTIWQENPGHFLDDGTGSPMIVERAWFKFASLQGYQRIRQSWIKGYFPGEQALQITIEYDYMGTIKNEVQTLNPNAGVNSAAWGGDTHWGDTSPWGYQGQTLYPDINQFQVHHRWQVGEAIKFHFEDLPPFQDDVAYELSAIDLEVGVLKGGYKMPPGKQIG
jgi:hypothetical protein